MNNNETVALIMIAMAIIYFLVFTIATVMGEPSWKKSLFQVVTILGFFGSLAMAALRIVQ